MKMIGQNTVSDDLHSRKVTHFFQHLPKNSHVLLPKKPLPVHRAARAAINGFLTSYLDSFSAHNGIEIEWKKIVN
jgi:hypothetical protein